MKPSLFLPKQKITRPVEITAKDISPDKFKTIP
jgi:hypothetical protein